MAKQNYIYSTAQERITEHRKRVGDQADTSIEFMQDESLLDAINTFKRQIINAPFSGMEIDSSRRITVPANGRGWDFMEEDHPLIFKLATTIEGAISEGGTGNLEVGDSTVFKNEAGAAIIYDSYGTWDYVTYAGLSGAFLQTMGDVSMDHASGEEIIRLYKLPADFARAKKLTFGKRQEFYEGPEDPEPGFFCTYNGFLWMPRRNGLGSATLTYYRQPTVLEDLDEDLDIPVELNPVLDNLLDARAFRLGGDSPSLVADALFAAADALRGAMGYTTSSSNKRIKLARPMPRSPTSLGRYRGFSRFDEANYD